MWLGVVIVAGAHAPARQDNSIAPNKTSATAVKSTAPAAGSPPSRTLANMSAKRSASSATRISGSITTRRTDAPRTPRTPAAKNTCETCHGPGKAHVDADGDGHIKDFTKMAPRQVGETCTTCHARSEHNNWAGSKHDSRNMSCTTCHSVHEPKSTEAQLKKETVTETCVQCHKKEVAKVHRSSHMPVREGKLECTTCHNPHGSQNVKMLREGNSINEACATCHAEKRGPFLWEHAAGRENCVTCHDPHGTNNERMLVAKLPMLCQRCHVSSRHPATIYENTQVNVSKSNRAVGRSCVNCHAMIHGSNHPSGAVFFR